MKLVTSELATGGASVYEYDDKKLKMIKKFGEQGPGQYIQKSCHVTLQGQSYFILGRKGLKIDILDQDFQWLKTKTLMSASKNSDFFITMLVKDGEFKACTGLGYCYFIPLEKLLNSKYNDFSMSFGLHGSINFFHFLPNNRVIIGGKDREIAIIDLYTHTNVWKSKNVKREPGEPIWIQDVIMFNDGFIAASRFGKLLWYDDKISKYPLDEIQVMDNPIKHFLKVNNECVLLGDSFNNVILFDIILRQVINKFQVFTGAISSLSIHTWSTGSPVSFELFVSSQIDERLRIYHYEQNHLSLLNTYKLNTIIPELMILYEDYTNDSNEPETKRRRID